MKPDTRPNYKRRPKAPKPAPVAEYAPGHFCELVFNTADRDKAKAAEQRERQAAEGVGWGSGYVGQLSANPVTRRRPEFMRPTGDGH